MRAGWKGNGSLGGQWGLCMELMQYRANQKQILVGFAGQALMSLCLSIWMFFLTKHGNMDITHPEGSIEREIEYKRLDFVSNILMVGSDFQSTLGISYLITTLSHVRIQPSVLLNSFADVFYRSR